MSNSAAAKRRSAELRSFLRFFEAIKKKHKIKLQFFIKNSIHMLVKQLKTLNKCTNYCLIHIYWMFIYFLLRGKKRFTCFSGTKSRFKYKNLVERNVNLKLQVHKPCFQYINFAYSTKTCLFRALFSLCKTNFVLF
jgi:hypothetical protein